MSAFHSGAKSGGALERLDALLDWSPIAEPLGRLHASAKGEAAWPPLAMFKALLLSVWHDLSDVKLAEALDDRASFRRFCGFSSNEPTPEHTAFVRFRRAPVMAELDHILFETITAQLKARSVTVKTGTIVDATIIASAREGDVDGRWVKHKNKPAVHGFKAHVGADADTALVEEIDITPANGNDGRAGPDTLPPEPGDVFADSAYRGRHFAQAIHAKGGQPRIIATAMWGRDETETLALEHRRGFPPSTLPSNGCVPGSKRSLERGREATVCVACDGGGWRKPAHRFASPQSPTISNAASQ